MYRKDLRKAVVLAHRLEKLARDPQLSGVLSIREAHEIKTAGETIEMLVDAFKAEEQRAEQAELVVSAIQVTPDAVDLAKQLVAVDATLVANKTLPGEQTFMSRLRTYNAELRSAVTELHQRVVQLEHQQLAATRSWPLGPPA